MVTNVVFEHPAPRQNQQQSDKLFSNGEIPEPDGHKAMLTEMHFILVLHALVEPDLKLTIQRRQIRIDEDPYLEFGYDPMIGRDNLTMLLPENLRFLYKGRESEIPQVLFSSPKYTELTKVFLKIRSTPEGLQIVAHCGDNGLRYAVEFLEHFAVNWNQLKPAKM